MMSGRARGRARGSARKTNLEVSGPLRRPGDAGQQAQGPQLQTSPENPVVPSGRARFRQGAGRGTPTPGSAAPGSGDTWSQRPSSGYGRGGQPGPETGYGRGAQHGPETGYRRGAQPGPGSRGALVPSWSNVAGGARPKTGFTRSANGGHQAGGGERTLTLLTNYFKITNHQEQHVYLYHMSFEPEIDENRRLMYGLLSNLRESVLRDVPYEALGNTLLTMRELGEQKEPHVVESRQGERYMIRFKLGKEIHREDYEYTYLYSLIIRRSLEMMDLLKLQRDAFYNLNETKYVPDLQGIILKLSPGYLVSTMACEMGVALNVQLHYKVLREDTVLDVIARYLSTGAREGDKNKVEELVRNKIVMTNYGKNRTYTVLGVCYDPPLYQRTFQTKSGEVSFLDYYKKAYDIDIKDGMQPLLRVKVKKNEKPALLVPELCSLTGIPADVRSNFYQMRALTNAQKMTPREQVGRLSNFIQAFRGNEQAVQPLKRWGIEVAENLLTVQAHTLNPERIIFARDCFNYKPYQAKWQEAVHGSNTLLECVPLHSWLVVYPEGRGRPIPCKEAAQNFVSELKQVAPAMGMKVEWPSAVSIQRDHPEDYIRAIRERLGQAQMVACVLPHDRDKYRMQIRYGEIKKECINQLGVPSQLMLNATLNKSSNKFKSCVTNIAMQMNVKLGGQLWRVAFPEVLKKAMVIGIDVYHPGREKCASPNAKSVGAVTCSLNANFTRYFSASVDQLHRGTELFDTLQPIVERALKEFLMENKFLPDPILIFRDGVGDGQIQIVKDHELPQIKAAIRTAANYSPVEYRPAIAEVIVQKRICSRFYTVQTRENPPPGTVVDSGVTRPVDQIDNTYDFYLVSQSRRDVTVSPTHYYVIYDTTGMTPSQMQGVTYKLTHLYYNLAGTVSVPSPCYYAHKLAFLYGEYNIETKAPKLELQKSLYYL
ncbi:piwi-like protein 1 [Lingula anatina]|uniref:Piwi-like protein 1 n=1 Tax=Lingula anatina TaxID=7574 RepID=A0A1S3HV26_LINAN|nr:piwi-like protein 1 [Lingula anatina]|eukprot:XP_013389895.1 piwi-like protein 1 [Lingula anatina]